MKVLTVVGARPQFIKCAPVSRELRKEAVEVLVHTGQHYDDNMSRVFFRELAIPEPDYNLGVGSGSHGAQTGEMLKRIEKVINREHPGVILVYGDTNSTLAGALAAAKLCIPVAHVEAGLRSFNRTMPEEINRVVTDHLSDLLFCPTQTSVKNLSQEGITNGVHLVGDVMYDALLFNVQVAENRSGILDRLGLRSKAFYLATVHRAENTDEPGRLGAIIDGFHAISQTAPVVWPVHPRTWKVLESWYPGKHAAGSWGRGSHGLRLIEPVSYLDMLVLEKHAKIVLTDSGGVQKEAFWLQVPCVTLRGETEWIETVDLGWNVLVGTDTAKIVEAACRPEPAKTSARPFGEGRAAVAIVGTLSVC